MRIQYRPAAIADLRRASDYIRYQLKNPKAAASLREKILHGISLLRENPYMGTDLNSKYEGLDSAYRFLVISKQIVFYEVNGETIDIVRILDGRTDYLSVLLQDF